MAGTARRNEVLRGGNRLPLGDQEPVGCDAQRGVVVEAAPSSSFEVAEADLLLEFLVIALDAPAQLGKVDQTTEGDAFGKGRKPVFGWLLLSLGPLDQQPLFRSIVGELIITMRDTNPHERKSRGQPLGRAFPPFDRAPGALGQVTRERLDRVRSMFGVTADQLRRSSAARPFLWRQRPCAWRPDRRVRHNAGYVPQPERRDVRTQIGVGTIAGV